MKSIRFLILILLFAFVFSCSAYCGWKDTLGLGVKTAPKPPSAKKVRTEQMKVMGINFPVTIYSSKDSFAEISRFYRRKLVSQGWEDLLSKQSIMSGGTSGFAKMLIFIKDEEMITVQELPSSGASTDTYFSVSRGESSLPKYEETERPEPKDVPIYPNARPIPMYFDFGGTQPLGYATSDSVESVIDFYKGSMPSYGWALEADMPIQEKRSSKADLEAIPNYNQILPGGGSQSQDFYTKMGSVRFKKERKRCTISAAEVPSYGSLPAETTISIDYSE